MLCISTALHHSYLQIKILLALRGCHHRGPLSHCSTMKTLNSTIAWGCIGETQQFCGFHLLFREPLQGLHRSRCPRCWQKSLHADFNENLHIALGLWSFICCLENDTRSSSPTLSIRTSDNACSLAWTVWMLYQWCSCIFSSWWKFKSLIDISLTNFLVPRIKTRWNCADSCCHMTPAGRFTSPPW